MVPKLFQVLIGKICKNEIILDKFNDRIKWLDKTKIYRLECVEAHGI